MSDMYKIWRTERIRDYQRRNVGAGRTNVTFQIPIEGIARSGISIHNTDPLDFGVGFYPKKGDRFGLVPQFLAGFSIQPTGIGEDRRRAIGLMAFANCSQWLKNDDGFFTKAVVQIGIVNLSADEEEINFKGYATLSFTGKAVQAPLDSGGHDQYTGPQSVRAMEYYFDEEDNE